jgi:hypothetical protein
MRHDPELRTLERNLNRSATDDGIADLRAAALLSVFWIAPLLSSMLGDFWSLVLWLPAFLAAEALLRRFRCLSVSPRSGDVHWSAARVARNRRMLRLAFAANAIFVAAGAACWGLATRGFRYTDWGVPAAMALFRVFASAAAGHAFHLARFPGYGLAAAATVLAGEWLFHKGMVSHHGSPAAFGASCPMIAGIGLWRLRRFLRANPPSATGESHGGT